MGLDDDTNIMMIVASPVYDLSILVYEYSFGKLIRVFSACECTKLC